MLPIRIVKKEGLFKTHVKKLDPRYELPTRKYMSKKPFRICTVLQENWENHKLAQQFFVATTDIWSSSAMEPYLSYTLHHIYEDWQLKNHCWEMLYLPQNHTGINITEAF